MPRDDIRYPEPKAWLLLGVASSAAAVAFGWYAESTARGSEWFVENGPVEVPETITLAIACVIFIARVGRSRGPVPAWCIPIAYMLFHAVLRETPRCDSPFYSGGTCLSHEWKYGLVVLASAIAVFLLILRRADIFEMLKPRWSLVFWPLVVPVILLFLAEFFEKSRSIAVEESLELAAFGYTIVFAAWVFRKT